MQKRIITGAVALLLFIPVLYFSQSVAFPFVLGLLAGIAVYEFARCVGLEKGGIAAVIPIVLSAGVLPFFARIDTKWIFVACLGTFLYILFMFVVLYGKVDTSSWAVLFFGFVYTAVSFAALVVARDAEPHKYLLIFVAAWATDTFAYFGGFLFGKRKLCPNLSPKKTVAGAISGVFGAVVCFLLFGVIINASGGDFDYLKYCIIAVPASIAAQFGDLAASAIKRHYGVKDYGNLFPGHGGVLDRFDSILPLSLGMFVVMFIIG